jgi:hypothetical protein
VLYPYLSSSHLPCCLFSGKKLSEKNLLEETQASLGGAAIRIEAEGDD